MIQSPEGLNFLKAWTVASGRAGFRRGRPAAQPLQVFESLRGSIPKTGRFPATRDLAPGIMLSTSHTPRALARSVSADSPRIWLLSSEQRNQNCRTVRGMVTAFLHWQNRGESIAASSFPKLAAYTW